MEKCYQPKDTEPQLYHFWEQQGLFAAHPRSQKPPYSLLMPPPNLTGQPHIGHAMQHTVLDILARFKRMQGYDVLLLPGVDHAGIQFQATLERTLSKEGLKRATLTREQFLKRAWQFKEEVYNAYHDVWKVTGISADWKREVFTLDPKPSRAVFEAFNRLFDEGLIYKGAYIVQWCPRCETAIEDVEMEYEERHEKLFFVSYEIPDKNEKITVATTRPETIFADTAIAVYPTHPRYHKLIGSLAINPLTKTRLPIIADTRIDTRFGTGAVKITPAHDPLDFAIGKDHHLPTLSAVDKTGRMTEIAGSLAGMKALDARQKAHAALKELGALVKTEDYTHAVPVCERCRSVVEPLISEEYFIKMATLGKQGVSVLRSGAINFQPPAYRTLLTDWLNSLHDWCISRDLWWGHRIPVWFCTSCNPNHELSPNKGVMVSERTPNLPCAYCKNPHAQWEQEPKVLDTWFSSGLWPLSTLGWPDHTQELSRYFPWDFEISAGEIKYLWIARMVALAKHFIDQMPWKNMYFHGMMRDLQGRKFSKSLGNGVDPLVLINQHGTDAFRMAMASYALPGRDQRMSPQTAGERAKSFRNFANKLWNIARFVLMYEHKGTHKKRTYESIHKDDRQILAQLKKTDGAVTKALEQYRFADATHTLYEFVWHAFADVYIEKTKTRRADAQPTLLLVLSTIVRLLHPFMPFVTEELWQRLPNKTTVSIMTAPWPES